MDPASQGSFTIPDLSNADLPTPAVGLREDQVQNAVAFLSHPKVRGSSEDSKRSFLERKGLTEDEIAEGLRRPAPQPVRWTQVLLGASVLAAGAYGLKQLCYPTVQRWYENWAAGRKPPAAIEPSEATKVAEAMQAQNAELRETVQSLQAMVKMLEKAKQPATPDSGLSVSELRQELRSFATTLGEFTSAPHSGTAIDKKDIDELKTLMLSVASQSPSQPTEVVAQGVPVASQPGSIRAASAQPAANGIARSLAFTASPGASPATLTPNPTAASPLWQTNPTSSPAWTSNPLGSTQSPAPFSVPPVGQPEPPPHPASYMEVLEMLEKGQTPPGIRTDINDQPPNPAQAPTDSRLQPRPKPWERAAAAKPLTPFTQALAPSATDFPAFPASGATASNGVTITEVTDEAGGSGGSSSAAPAWKPPAVPQPSVKLGRAKSSASVSASSEAGSATASER
ncbi:hypothetical protein WJX72_002195 [[Myrmecia] bisecta]|uniref:Peroxisomal membrane protein PEX14 n=1 Tax=[Myrmecia] bisecta TaxID=41462 RepID=A0AAW1PCU9_9CHLO